MGLRELPSWSTPLLAGGWYTPATWEHKLWCSRPFLTYLFTWWLICILYYISYNKPVIIISVSLSSMSHSHKWLKPRMGLWERWFIASWSEVHLTILDLQLVFEIGPSCGTQSLNCEIWHELQVVSKLNWLVGHNWCCRID